jgi:ABC-type multidrug transport system ATPase subunit
MVPRFALAFSRQVSYQALRRRMPAQLEARRLRKTYGGRVLLDEVDLRLAGGSITTLSGPSGSGKTTLLRILGLLSDADEGQLLLDGVDLRAVTPHAARRRIALVAQAPLMFPGTVLDNVRTGPRLAGEELPEATARELVVRAGLPPELLTQDAQSLSGGEKLRVAVARALALRPEAWLLDEPTAALDADRADLIVRLLRALASEGAAILMVTHDARALQQLEGPHFQLSSGSLVEGRPLSGAAS